MAGNIRASYHAHYRFKRKDLETFLACDSVKEFYLNNGSAQAYQEFLEKVRNAHIAGGMVYMNFYGDSNTLGHFNIAFNKHPENFDKIKHFNLEFEVQRIFTRDDRFFYSLNFSYRFEKKGFNKSPVPNNSIKV